MIDRKSTRLNSSHTVIYTLSLHDALPILLAAAYWDHRLTWSSPPARRGPDKHSGSGGPSLLHDRSEEHTSELQSHSDLHSFPTRRSSDLAGGSLLGSSLNLVQPSGAPWS